MNKEELAKNILDKFNLSKSAEHVKEVTSSSDAASYIEDLDLWTGKDVGESDVGDSSKDLFNQDIQEDAQLPSQEPNDGSGSDKSDEEQDLDQGYSVDKSDMYTGSGKGPKV